MTTSRLSLYATVRPATLGLAKVLLLAIAHLPRMSAAPISLHYLLTQSGEGEPPGDPSLWLHLGVAAALVLMGGAFAGLTIALMGQDEIHLQVIQTSGEESEKKNAASVLGLLRKGKHWVLVTLLLSNVITNETLPIVLDRSLGGGWPAVVGSTVLIVIFGEIVPQSICVRFGLPIGAWMAPCVLVLMYLMSPVAWPIAKLLDKLLGKDHGTVYKKAGLKTLVTLHKTLGVAGEQLTSDEVTIISACLDLKDKSVGSIMTPMEDVFTMSADTILDEATMDLMLSQGYSRIPIRTPDNPANFVGMLLVKMLITYDPDDCKMVRDFALATLPETRPETSCLDIVNYFQEGKSHMVLVSDHPGEDYGALGVVTLEDVIEELIGEEIIDESDVFIDVHKAIRRLAPAPKSRFPKGRIVEEPPSRLMSFQEDSLADGSNGAPLSRTVSGASGRRRSSIGPQPSKFYFRHRNGEVKPAIPNDMVSKLGAEEIREHLRHLGPSNLASRPRRTRYQSVKIKPGLSQTSSEVGQRLLEPTGDQSEPEEIASLAKKAENGVEVQPESHEYAVEDGDESPDLVMDPNNTNSAALLDNDSTELSVGTIAIEDHAGNAHRAFRNDGTGHKNSSWSYARSSDYVKTPPRVTGPTRSGSITEQIIDVNGIRKVVLHPTSSSSSDTDRANQSHSTGNDDNDPTDSETPTRAQNFTSSQGGKKKRRRKKRSSRHKGIDGSEAERRPLLQ